MRTINIALLDNYSTLFFRTCEQAFTRFSAPYPVHALKISHPDQLKAVSAAELHYVWIYASNFAVPPLAPLQLFLADCLRHHVPVWAGAAHRQLNLDWMEEMGIPIYDMPPSLKSLQDHFTRTVLLDGSDVPPSDVL